MTMQRQGGRQVNGRRPTSATHDVVASSCALHGFNEAALSLHTDETTEERTNETLFTRRQDINTQTRVHFQASYAASADDPGKGSPALATDPRSRGVADGLAVSRRRVHDESDNEAYGQ
jgi:hypothetical protein